VDLKLGGPALIYCNVLSVCQSVSLCRFIDYLKNEAIYSQRVVNAGQAPVNRTVNLVRLSLYRALQGHSRSFVIVMS